jgi:hypothetical protein
MNVWSAERHGVPVGRLGEDQLQMGELLLTAPLSNHNAYRTRRRIGALPAGGVMPI